MSKGIKEMTDHQLQAAADAGDITASALFVEQKRRHAAAHPEPIIEGWTLDRVMLRPGTALEELLYYRRRVQELLETTNRYLDRARAAEAFIADTSTGAAAHIHKHGLKLLADGLRAEVYPTSVKHEHMRPLYTSRPLPDVTGAEVIEAARNVIASASDTYKKRNGHLGSFEDDSGEKCWIVPFDAFESLRSAVDALKALGGSDAE